jgi:ribosomal protein S18 acetylase RimI-like enzyme
VNNYNWRIDDNYQIRAMEPAEFEPLFQKYTKEFFDDETQVFRLRDSLSDDERSKLKKLSANMGEPFELRLGIFHKNEFVGWHFGQQDKYASFYMQNSGILPQHRRQGLYAELVKRILQVATEMGFQDIWSRHNATNNAVIIPKLKQGFVITALEVTDVFGTLVHLHYYPKEVRRKMTDYRVGQIKPDTEIKRYLGF